MTQLWPHQWTPRYHLSPLSTHRVPIMTVLFCPLHPFSDINVRFYRSGIPTHGPEYAGMLGTNHVRRNDV